MLDLYDERFSNANNTAVKYGFGNLRFTISAGLVEYMQAAGRFGRSTDVDVTEPPVDVWPVTSIYTGFPVSDVETMEIYSSSANDSAEGSGAIDVTIFDLLDGDKNLMPPITVTLNGANPVSLGAQTYSRASKMIVRKVGVTGSNEGIITLRHTTTIANVFAVMPIGLNATSIMAFTVPAGKTLFVDRGFISMARDSGTIGSANCTIRVREDIPDAPFIATRDIEINSSSPYYFENSGFFVFTEKMDFKVTIEDVSDNNTIIMSEYDGFIVDNSVL